MNIFGSLFTFENINFNCFKNNEKYHSKKFTQELNKNLINIQILPLQPNIKINKIPIGNCINELSTIIISKDNIYISLKLYGDLCNYIDETKILNKYGTNILNDELNNFFDNVILQTKNNKKIQILFILNNILYFLNTYQLVEDDIVGFVIFIRPFSSI
jgi:hypothetical protein